MLSREDSRRLALMERQLLRDDPDFYARMTVGLAETVPEPVIPFPRRKRPPLSLILTAVVAWVSAILLAVFGWWIAAGLAAFCAVAVMVGVVHLLRSNHRRGWV